jgi:glycosyltransferase involved in cell wall biosynthesis
LQTRGSAQAGVGQGGPVRNAASATEATPSARSVQLERLRAEIDSVYFLMYDGWDEELESNRWHYARRWARELPVTLLQPRQHVPRRQDAVAVAGIDNCEVLPVAKPGGEMTAYPLPGLIQAAQVMEHMARRGHERSLLWSYNPWLTALYAAVPAVARVYHASENHFDFVGMSEFFYREVEATVRISDLVIAVSSGVAEGLRMRVPEAKLALVTNGCDISCYRPAGPVSAEMTAMRGGFGRVAVFAGSINSRVDFELVERAAESNNATLFVLAGPVGPLDERDARTWRRVLGLQNVRHLGRMTPDALAALYRSADLGVIPYRREARIVRNGFPLKTLEMAATGLPVVASHMEPIVGLASAITVAEDDERFLESFASVSRSAVTDEERLELLEVAAANDYDCKFEQVVASVADSIPAGRAARTRLDDLMLDLGYGPWSASCTRIFSRFRASPVPALVFVYVKLAETLPTWVHQRVPTWLRDHVRRLRAD